MRLIIDANVILSAILGSANRLRVAVGCGAETVVVDAQLSEARKVLVKLGASPSEAEDLVASAVSGTAVVALEDVATEESAARQRLHERGQVDWPVLAAALVMDAAIWSDDRDFFGVGVAVWSNNNISHALPPGALNA